MKNWLVVAALASSQLIACGRDPEVTEPTSAAAGSKSPPSETSAAETPTPAPQPNADNQMLADFAGFADEMCACTTPECTKAVQQRLTDWAKDKPDPSPELQKRLLPEVTRSMDCARKIGGKPRTTSAPVKPGPIPVWEPIGVNACDDYGRSFMRCVAEHVPEAGRKQLVDAFNANRGQWAEIAKSKEGRDGLADACVKSMAAAAEVMKQFGCNL